MSVAVAFPKAPAQKLQRARLDSTSHRGCLMRVAPLRSSWAIAVAATLALSACKKPPSAPPPQVPEVGVLILAPRAITVETELSGRTAASLIAEIWARVDGIVEKRTFTEGGEVKAGQSLYTIDQAAYQAKLDSARASLAKAERYTPVVAAGAVSRQEYDNTGAARDQAAAKVAAAQAAVKAAQINLGYTRVHVPIRGQISRSYVTPGAYVQAGAATLLATIQQIDPIEVDLTQSSAERLRLRREMDAGRLQTHRAGAVRVNLTLEDGSRYPHTGTLQFSDTMIDLDTSTLHVRARFPNPDRLLLPGMFVRAQIRQGNNPNALLIPQNSVTFDPKGEATVLVVGKDGKAALRSIKVTQTFEGHWIVSEGVQAGERVVVQGAQQGMLHITPGMPVKAAPVQPARAQRPSSAPPSQSVDDAPTS